MIYADNAATTQLCKEAKSAMIQAMEVYGNPSSIHAAGQEAAGLIENARYDMANALGCHPRELVFTSGGTEADNQAIVGAAYLGRKQGKMHIVSDTIEHHAVLRTLERLKGEGFEITLIQPDAEGFISAKQVEEALREDTCLVSIMYANNEIGTIEPISEIGKLCREHGVLFHTDAVQAAGHMKIDVSKEYIDLLSLSAHKFHGPKGIGALYIRRGINIAPYILGGGQEKGKRAGTENVIGIAGMAEALKVSLTGIDEKLAKVEGNRDMIISCLESIPGTVLNGPRLHRLPGNINMTFENVEAETLIVLLNNKGIFVSAGAACSSGAMEPSHVIVGIGRKASEANSSIRISIDEYNTEEDINGLVAAVRESVEHLRGV